MVQTPSHTEITADITAFIQTEILNEMGDDGGEELTPDTPLLEWGILDSITMVKLVDHINQRFEIRIREEEVIPANFINIHAIAGLVELACQQRKEGAALGDDVFAHYLHEMKSYELQRKPVTTSLGTIEVTTIHGSDISWVILPPLGFPAGCVRGILWGLESYHSAYALDLPGFGLAPEPVNATGFDGLVDLVGAFLKTLEDRPVVLMGHGLSGLVASAVAKREPSRVKVLLLTGLGKIEDAALFVKGRQATLPQIVSWLDAGHFYPTKLDGYLTDLLKVVVESQQYLHVLEDLAAVAGNWHEGLTVPTLFIHGTNDPYLSEASVASAAAAIPGGLVKSLARCGHFPAFECPDEMIQLVRSFLRTLD